MVLQIPRLKNAFLLGECTKIAKAEAAAKCALEGGALATVRYKGYSPDGDFALFLVDTLGVSKFK